MSLKAILTQTIIIYIYYHVVELIRCSFLEEFPHSDANKPLFYMLFCYFKIYIYIYN